MGNRFYGLVAVLHGSARIADSPKTSTAPNIRNSSLQRHPSPNTPGKQRLCRVASGPFPAQLWTAGIRPGDADQAQATDIEIHARDLIASRRSLAGIYEQTTGKPIDQILKDIERDYYMTAQEAQEYGIVDQVFSKENRSVSPNSPSL
jgi:hypothetical protein